MPRARPIRRRCGRSPPRSPTWPTRTMEAVMDQRAAFLEAALWHGSLDAAAAILAAHPDIAGSDIHTVAVLGDEAAVRRFLAQDPGNATAKSAPYGGGALNHLFLFKYLPPPPPPPARLLRAAAGAPAAPADPPPAGCAARHQPPHAA